MVCKLALSAHEAISYAIEDVQGQLEIWIARRDEMRESVKVAESKVDELSRALMELKIALRREA